MDIQSDYIIKLLRKTARCRSEIKELAGQNSGLSASRYNELAVQLNSQGDGRTLGILLNVAALNKIKFDPLILASTLKSLDIIIDINFPYKYQDEKAIGPLLDIALAEDLSWERQILAARLAAELTIKFGSDKLAVKKVLWVLSREVSSFESRMMAEGALDFLENCDNAPNKNFWFIELDLLRELPKNRPPTVIGGDYTVRRPVAKIGRNEPCHCGSKKKYKKCCYLKDQELLKDASAYEGVTKTQLLDQPSLVEDITPIESLRVYELKKLKPKAMNDDQLVAGHQRCMVYGLRKLAFQMLLELKTRPGKEKLASDYFYDLYHSALSAQDRELASECYKYLLDKNIKLLQSDKIRYELLDNSDKYGDLERLCAESVVGANDEHTLLELSYAFEKILPALSVVFGRAAIVSEPSRWIDNEVLLDIIERNRIALDLDPEGDPIEDYLDWTIEKKCEDANKKGKERELNQVNRQLMETREKNALISKELRHNEAELGRIEKKISNAEKKISKSDTSLTNISPPNEIEMVVEDHNNLKIKALKNKVETLKREIDCQQESRRQLRMELRDAHEKLSNVNKKKPITTEVSVKDDQSLIDPVMSHKIRPPEFTVSFRKSCDSMPSAIVAKALSAAIGFVSRDTSVLKQTNHIERLPGIFRIRIGLHYRLIVQLNKEKSVKVLDLISRQNLETWIRQYSRVGYSRIAS